ncbi:hypothetical protein [Gordonia sp. NB41Y]|uniref:hypothetical protein n=1 Tax=Gordonia sp. NB41Y TaxID=875808 RepID=UPI0002BF6708|nr:hypothetical protein [Gordonia sp. NB41Y]EMP11283.1 hypothetical protein ISGA_5168 [Gordonia sp. NB41Y]WLP89400.1 hypothetical protein Q9K23_17680 [Gordonia sp. NB41Y]
MQLRPPDPTQHNPADDRRDRIRSRNRIFSFSAAGVSLAAAAGFAVAAAHTGSGSAGTPVTGTSTVTRSQTSDLGSTGQTTDDIPENSGTGALTPYQGGPMHGSSHAS